MAYNKHTWQTGETITATKLNNIENGIATNDSAIGDIPEQIDAIQEELESKANIDGAYESMTVGNAEQLVSTQFVEDNAPYVFRTSGGSADIGNREEDTIIGGTVAWNQLLPVHTSVSVFSGNADGLTYGVTDGYVNISGTATETCRFNIFPTPTSSIPANHVIFMIPTNYNGFKWGRGGFGEAVRTGLISKHSAEFSAIPRILVTAEETVNIHTRFNLFDLTVMFGSAVADAVYAMEQANAGTGVAWFKAQYPLDYYAYNTGELKSVEGLESHDMVGFNQWDEEWELGGYAGGSGEPWDTNTRIRSKTTNYIKVIPNTAYFVNMPTGTGMYLDIMFYDSLKNFVGTVNPNAMTQFTTPSDAMYMRFATSATYGTTYNNDICINLSWSGTRNGEYEPYVKRSYPLDSTLTLRGIPKVDADGQMYYDGDVYSADGTVTRKYGVVDLGSLTWTRSLQGSIYLMVADSIADMVTGYTSSTPLSQLNVFGVPYSYKDIGLGWQTMADKTFGFAGRALRIRDDSYTDATAFQTAMSGVYLVYELATPTTEQAEPYQAIQAVEDWGTEEYVTTGIVAVGHNTIYPQNLRDKLQHLPVLAEDDGAYLIQQTGTQMHLVNFRIPKAENLADGTYVLKATVSGGTPTYTWEAE